MRSKLRPLLFLSLTGLFIAISLDEEVFFPEPDASALLGCGVVALVVMLTRHSFAAVALVFFFSAGSVQAQPVIQEVFYDEVGPDDGDQVFTELFGAPGFDLAGWSLVGLNGSGGSAYRIIDLSGGVIPADGIFVIATAAASGEALANRDFVSNVDWQNGPDCIVLFNAASQIVDGLQYGDTAGNCVGEGSPAVDVSAGSSLSRANLATDVSDTNDNSNDFSELNPPSPGSGPVLPAVPGLSSVGAVLLVLIVVAATAIRGRRGLVRRRRSLAQ